jgi:hypothetical protein
MKCPECSGKGTVEVPDYRTNAVPPDQESVDIPAVKKASDWRIALSYSIILTTAVVFVIIFGRKIGEQRSPKEKYDSTHPYLTVQYALDGAPLHCWISAPNITRPTIMGSGVSIQVNDAALVETAETLGIHDIYVCSRLISENQQ